MKSRFFDRTPTRTPAAPAATSGDRSMQPLTAEQLRQVAGGEDPIPKGGWVTPPVGTTASLSTTTTTGH